MISPLVKIHMLVNDMRQRRLAIMPVIFNLSRAVSRKAKPLSDIFEPHNWRLIPSIFLKRFIKVLPLKYHIAVDISIAPNIL